MNMKIAGIILMVLSALTIFINRGIDAENDKKMERHPFETMFTLGSNLTPCYKFTPPYSGFEWAVIACGGAGIVLFIIGALTRSDEIFQNNN